MSPFHLMHQHHAPLVLPCAWDAASALTFQAAGAQAVGTSSAALAWSAGWPDGDALPRAELLAAVHRLRRVLRVPLSVDMESGYSTAPDAVAGLAVALADLGVAGINLEDGGQNPRVLADHIAACRRALGSRPLFINARTDVFLHNPCGHATALHDTLARLRCYAASGADGGFVPGLVQAQAIAAIAAGSALPLNVMAAPGLPHANACAALGVRRISAGPWPMLAACSGLAHAAQAWLGSAGPWPQAAAMTHGIMNDLLLHAQP